MNHETIRRTLVQRAGGGANANAVANAAISTWHEASARLSPIIGGQGIDVLLRRSLHVAGKTFPALAEPTHEGRNNVLLANLQVRLSACETALAIEASNALLVTFTELMSSLIGESLTERLLAPIWAPSFPASEQKGAP
jgi:hypothetical protein